MTKCEACDLNVGRKDAQVACLKCGKSFHYPSCFPEQELHKEMPKEWLCLDCAKTNRQVSKTSDPKIKSGDSTLHSSATRGTQSSGNAPVVTMDVLLTEIRSSRLETAQRINEVKSELAVIASIQEQLQRHDTELKEMKLEISKSTERIDGLEQALERCREEIKQGRNENTNVLRQIKTYQDKCQRQEAHIIELQQYSRKKGVIIAGLPAFREENIRRVVGQLLTYLGVGDIRMADCHRLSIKTATSNVITTFCSFYDASRFLQAAKRKIREKKLAIADVYDGSEILQKAPPPRSQEGKEDYKDSISVYQQLCPALSRVHQASKKTAEELGYKYCWHQNGKIFMRAKENDVRIEMRSYQEVMNFRQELGLGPLMERAKT
jgi:hypothetical protein